MAERREHVFMVRMWSEGTHVGPPTWRGSVSHIGTGQTLFVAAPAEVAEFIAGRLGEPRPAEPNPEAR